MLKNSQNWPDHRHN